MKLSYYFDYFGFMEAEYHCIGLPNLTCHVDQAGPKRASIFLPLYPMYWHQGHALPGLSNGFGLAQGL